ncbi:MAG: PcfJ domain-containing protein [Clostridia bacterium]|nr:PcfJ domain-containing protein [Clostridia bacterium]
MDKVEAMRSFPLNFPREIVEYAEKNAKTQKQFASYLEVIGDDIVQRVFGFRKSAKKGLLITEVVRRITGTSKYLYKNMYYSRMNGYVPVYECENVKRYYYGYLDVVFGYYDFDVWYEWDDGLVNLTNQIVNLDEAFSKSDRFRYCGYRGGCNLMEYLNAFLEDPRVELFGKIGIPPKKTLVRKAKKDRQFCQFLRNNVSDINTFGAQATVYAYDHSMTIREARNYLYNMRYLGSDVRRKCGAILGRINISPLKVVEYLKGQRDSQGIELASSYGDYLRALEYLGYDMRDTKNIFPNDFRQMHDLRLAEYDSLKAKADKKERRKLYSDFRRAGESAKPLEWSNEQYAIIIPTNAYDLVREGRALNHCVGKQGYDVKVAKGEVLIAFVRQVSRLDEPYVTVEYGFGKTPASDKLYQQHGRNNDIPDVQTQKFIEEWVARAKKIRKELMKNAG